MNKELSPDDILKDLAKGRLAAFYLFYGPGEFGMERTLNRIRESFIPAAARDFNLHLFYAGETTPVQIIQLAMTLPFMAKNRLIIVRRTEECKAEDLEKFLPYLEKPVESSTLIFTAANTDFKRRFYKTMRAKQRAVLFDELKERQVIPWIKQTNLEMGLKMDQAACVYLQQVVGNNARDLYAELEKIQLRFGAREIGLEQVKELVSQSRIYTIFELINMVSVKNLPEALLILNRFLEEEDKKGGPLRLMGMLNRQVRLLWQTKLVLSKGGKVEHVAHALGLHPFAAQNLAGQARHWNQRELVQALRMLYQVDSGLKSGMRPQPVLESLVMLLCEKKDSSRSESVYLAAEA